MAKQPVQSPLYQLPDAPRSMGGIMWEAIIVGLLCILLVSWIATQYAASKLGYQDALGEPIWILFGTQIYQPFGWIVWGWKYGEMDNPFVKDVFARVYYGVTACVSLGIFVAMTLAYRRSRGRAGGTAGLHGSAHWATKKEVQATGLLDGGKGVYVGAYNDNGTIRYLRHDGPEHIMAFAPTRSGKGVGLILPTLLSWTESAVVYDTKGENFALTAGWRGTEANNLILKFDPVALDDSSVKYNALNEIRLRTEREVSDVQNIVNMIVDPDGKGLNDHWAKTGSALLVGAVLHVLYSEPNKTLTGVADFLSDPSRTILDTLTYMLQTEHDPEGKRGWVQNVHPVVAASARDMLNKSENEMSGVLSTAMSFLTLYRDPVVSKNTAYSEFKIADLMNADRPATLYLVVPPSDKDRLKPLIRLIINQIVRGLTEKMDFKDGRSVAGYKHRLLLMLDEFPSLGKLDIFEESLAFIAGYGMKAYLIIQDISQLWTAYGKDESIFSNCHIRAAYAPNKIETATLLSQMTGGATILKDQTSYSGDRMQPMLGNVSTSVQEVSRQLLTPDEVMRLPAAVKDGKGNITAAGDMLIFAAGHAPIYGKQILYFLDPTFSARSKIPAPVESDRLYAAPPTHQNAAGALDEPADVPTHQADPDPAIASSYESDYVPYEDTAGEVADAGDHADDEPVPIEVAPDELADDPAPADEQGGGIDAAPAPDDERPTRPRQADPMLEDMKQVSQGADDDMLGMFDDVLETPAAQNQAADRSNDLNDDMADVLAEAARPSNSPTR